MPTFRYEAWWTVAIPMDQVLTMNSQDKISKVIASILISASLGFAVVDPGIRPLFLEMTKTYLIVYAGAKTQKALDQRKKKE